MNINAICGRFARKLERARLRREEYPQPHLLVPREKRVKNTAHNVGNAVRAAPGHRKRRRIQLQRASAYVQLRAALRLAASPRLQATVSENSAVCM